MSINIISSRDCLPYLTSLIVCKDIFPMNRLQDTGTDQDTHSDAETGYGIQETG